MRPTFNWRYLLLPLITIAEIEFDIFGKVFSNYKQFFIARNMAFLNRHTMYLGCSHHLLTVDGVRPPKIQFRERQTLV